MITAVLCWPAHQKLYSSTAVGSECRRPAGFLGKEDRAYVSAAPRATLAQSDRAHQVPFMRVDVPLSSRHSAKLLCRDHSSSFRPCYAASSPSCTIQHEAAIRNKPFFSFHFHLLTRRLCWCPQLAVRHWATACFQRLQQEPGIRCLVMSGTCLLCSSSAANSRLYCLGCRTLSIDSFNTVS